MKNISQYNTFPHQGFESRIPPSGSEIGNASEGFGFSYAWDFRRNTTFLMRGSVLSLTQSTASTSSLRRLERYSYVQLFALAHFLRTKEKHAFQFSCDLSPFSSDVHVKCIFARGIFVLNIIFMVLIFESRS